MGNEWRTSPNRAGSSRTGWLLPALVALGVVACSSGPRAPSKPWKGAEMLSSQEFLYGAFEARIMGARGSGMITPFFLFKDGGFEPGEEWQELDFEIFGKDGTYQTQVMTPGVLNVETGEARTEHAVVHTLPTPAWQRYYSYRMEWAPNRLSFFVDGRLVRQETDPVEFDKFIDPARVEPMRLRISLWAGDIPWSGPFDASAVPAAMFANWVAVSSYTPGAGPDGSDFTLLWRDDFDRQDDKRWSWADWTFGYAVNDYVPDNSTIRNGTLIQVLTTDLAAGAFP